MGDNLIELHNIAKVFRTDVVETHALSDVSVTVKQGDYVAVKGPSGCGKSTLLSILGLLDSASAGRYVLAGHDVSAISKRERARVRNKEIGFVFQSFNLISDLSVEENVALPLTYRDDLKRSEYADRVAQALEKVAMEHRSKHFPSQLSGGQQQRVAVARAIVGSPSIVLADEPTGNLDTRNAGAVMELFDALREDGATICMVTHDLRLAARAERSVELLDGKVVTDSLNRVRDMLEQDTLAEEVTA